MKEKLNPVSFTLNNEADGWKGIFSQLFDNPDGIVPAYFINTEHQKIGEFYVSMCVEGDKVFIQYEGFDNPDIAQKFVDLSNGKIQVFPGGIYRFEY